MDKGYVSTMSSLSARPRWGSKDSTSKENVENVAAASSSHITMRVSDSFEKSNLVNMPTQTFYGRMGSKRVPPTTKTLTKMDTGVVSTSLRFLRIQLIYDEDEYPAGIEVGLFAFLFDKQGYYSDTIFYRHTEDANGAFYLNTETSSLTIDLDAVPEECGAIALAAAVFTSGLSIPELQFASIEISSGYLNEPIYSRPLYNPEAVDLGEDKAGIVFMILSEVKGKWFYKPLDEFTCSSVDSLMSPCKGAVKEMLKDANRGKFTDIFPLSSLKGASENFPTNFLKSKFSWSLAGKESESEFLWEDERSKTKAESAAHPIAHATPKEKSSDKKTEAKDSTLMKRVEHLEEAKAFQSKELNKLKKDVEALKRIVEAMKSR